MENAAYIGLSRQMTLRRELDIVANNVANANTTGFKVEQLMVSVEVGKRARNDSIKPSASFVLDNGVGRDFGQGAMQQTGRGLDFAISGEGTFFTVRDGANGQAYTRDGAFTLDPEGKLTTKQGLAVLGGGAEIVLDPNLGAPPSVRTAPSPSRARSPADCLSCGSTPWACSKRAATAFIATAPTPSRSRRRTPRSIRGRWNPPTSIRWSRSPIWSRSAAPTKACRA